MARTAIIIGAGPAGLTAAYELLKRTDIVPVILEKSGDIGGISKTVDYKGNRIDIGGHRFFSKSDRVMQWWLNMMPLETGEVKITYHHQTRVITGFNTNERGNDLVMLVRKRISRIYFLKKFFAYPVKLSFDTLVNLGFVRTYKVIVSYLAARMFPRKPVKNLEDFMINQFGNELYSLFFRDYTEKVWGVACHQIPAEWGAQRIKGVSLSKALSHALGSLGRRKKEGGDIFQKDTETSLVERFLYPKYGPGQLWEEVANQVRAMGGKIYLNQTVVGISQANGLIADVRTVNGTTLREATWEGDFFFSTMPIQELIGSLNGEVPPAVREVAAGLQYRDFMTVGILLKRFGVNHVEDESEVGSLLKDTWIYIQEKDVKVGRLQIFNNWSPFMVKDPSTVWVGMEYFCTKGDAFWSLTDEAVRETGILELEKMGLAAREDVLDSTVLRMEKTYPAYFGTYDRLPEVRAFLANYPNLFLVGRNGMHKYNNSDHSMLTAMVAVDNIIAGIRDQSNIWEINTEQVYHEKKERAPEEVNEQGKTGIPEPADSRAGDRWPSFPEYVWGNKKNRAYLLVAAATFVIQFVLFKIRYPYANYLPDSYSYLGAASNNADVNMWPVAYSKFLRLVSVFTHSDKVLVGLQYFFLEASVLFFLFTFFYFIRPRKPIMNVLYAFVILNPIIPYLSNFISADTLFTGFSLLWLSVLFWILYRPRPWQLLVHAALLFCCFTLRYNALYYPVIGGIVFLVSRQRWGWRIGGVAIGMLVVMASISYTSGKMKEVTGKRQFSAFGGWQLASNALFMYSHVGADRKPPPAQLALLHREVVRHMDSLNNVKHRPDSSLGVYYLWNAKAPLRTFLKEKWGPDSTTAYFVKWASMAPLYAAYGQYLIETHPMAFARWFIWPNVLNYAAPPAEFLGEYNMGKDSVEEVAREWFEYKTQRVTHYAKDPMVYLIKKYPTLSAVINGSFLLFFLGFVQFGGFRKSTREFQRALMLFFLLWLINFLFSIMASPIVLRYQIFMIGVCFFFSVMLLDFILHEEITSENIESRKLVDQ